MIIKGEASLRYVEGNDSWVFILVWGGGMSGERRDIWKNWADLTKECHSCDEDAKEGRDRAKKSEVMGLCIF